jgi:hypothetical protein
MAVRTLGLGAAFALTVTLAFAGCAATSHRQSDQQLNQALADMIASAEIGSEGEIFFTNISDPRFLEPNSGRYWQISSEGRDTFRSRSLWDRTLEASGREAWTEPLFYSSDQFADEPLRIAERTVRLPGSDVEWQFVVASARD